jgi:hypothetical protein
VTIAPWILCILAAFMFGWVVGMRFRSAIAHGEGSSSPAGEDAQKLLRLKNIAVLWAADGFARVAEEHQMSSGCPKRCGTVIAEMARAHVKKTG